MKRVQVSPILKQRRELTESQWGHFVKNEPDSPRQIPLEISSSWQRSQPAVPFQSRRAPLNDPYEVKYRWHESPIHEAAQHELGKLMDIVTEGEFVTAISDAAGRLLWTYASRHMCDRAADENFIAGGDWGEQVAGTNAVGLCLVTRNPVTVFSAEHFRSSLHEWVCYASPIVHPQTGELMGVLDLSSTWYKHTPLGQSAVAEMARSIASQLPVPRQRAELELFMLGQPRVMFRGKVINLSLRHCEILCLLALNPQGLSLEALHAAVYGDNFVTKSTLKSEISILRSLLEGQISSRPYRLVMSVWADFVDLWAALRAKKTESALNLYQGSLLINSNSPEIEQWRYCIDGVMTKTLDACDDVRTLIEQCHMSAGELVRERLLGLTDYY